jgi:MFS family permease
VRFRWGRGKAAFHANCSEAPEQAFAEVLLSEGREELVRADGKASILLSAAGVILAAVLAGMLAGTWTPDKLGRHPATEVAFWLGAGIFSTGMLLMGAAVLPSTKHTGRRETLAYFGHVVRYNESKRFAGKDSRRRQAQLGKRELKKAMKVAAMGRFERTVDQVWTISHIVDRKYRYIRRGMVTFAIGAATCVGALIVYAAL